MDFFMSMVTSHISSNGPQSSGGEVNYGSLRQLRRMERERRHNTIAMVTVGVLVLTLATVLYFVL